MNTIVSDVLGVIEIILTIIINLLNNYKFIILLNFRYPGLTAHFKVTYSFKVYLSVKARSVG